MKKIIFVLFGMTASLWGESQVAKVTEIEGEATAKQPTATERVLSVGSPIFVKDTISVLENAAVQIEYVDSSVLLLKPATKFIISEYKYKENGNDNESHSQLLAGGFRILSGSMKTNGSNYDIKTPNATIGLLGTLVTAELQDDDSMYVECTKGHAKLTNEGGSIIIGEGMEQYAVITSYNRRPQIFIAPPRPTIRPTIRPR